MSSFFVCYLILLYSKIACTKDTEDDKLIYTSIPEMVKVLTTAIRIQENTERLDVHYGNKLRDAAEALEQLKTVQLDTNSNILHPIFFLKTILTINGIIQTKNHYMKQIENINDDLSKLTYEKFKGSGLKIDEHIRALFALQDFYNFDTEQAANGILNKSSINIRLSALDCYEIGSWALENQDAYHAKLWLNEAKRRLISESADRTVHLEKILLKLANVYSVYKDEEATHRHIEEILKIDPMNEAALQFQVILQASDTFYNMIASNYKTTLIVHNWGRSSRGTWIQQLCQQEQPFDIESSTVFCYYQDLYAYYHVKVEVVSMEPIFAIFHEVITNKEILAFHQQAALQNRLRSGMNHSTIIYSESNNVINNFKKKISVMAEPASVIDPFLYNHFDIGEFHKLKRKPVKDHKLFIEAEDRERGFLLMIFLNNVEGGGHVIFPGLNISIPPQKGNALIWDFEPGKTDKYLIHTICPIYAGNCTVVHARGYSKERYD